VVELDDLDRKATGAFPGHMVRKDLVRRFRGQFPVPTYVVEFMLGRYCAKVPIHCQRGRFGPSDPVVRTKAWVSIGSR
jgi:ATP-dependent Lon protease